MDASRNRQKLRLTEVTTFDHASTGTFSSDNKLLAFTGPQRACVVEMGSERCLIDIAPDKATIIGVRFLPKAHRFVVAYKTPRNTDTNTFRLDLYDSTGKQLQTISDLTDKWYRNISDLSFTMDGKWLASNIGGIPRLWKVSDGRESKGFLPPDNQDDLESERVLISPDGARLAVYFTGSRPESDLLGLWSLSDGKYSKLTTNIYRDWAFSPDSRLLAVTALQQRGLPGEHSAVEIWDIPALRLVKTIEVPDHWRGAYVVSLSPDGSTIAIGGYKKFGVFSAKTGELLAEAQHPRARFLSDNEMVNELTDIEFSPDGKFLLTGGNDGTVKLWRLKP